MKKYDRRKVRVVRDNGLTLLKYLIFAKFTKTHDHESKLLETFW